MWGGRQQLPWPGQRCCDTRNASHLCTLDSASEWCGVTPALQRAEQPLHVSLHSLPAASSRCVCRQYEHELRQQQPHNTRCDSLAGVLACQTAAGGCGGDRLFPRRQPRQIHAVATPSLCGEPVPPCSTHSTFPPGPCGAAADIKWLGVRPSDLDRFNIPQQCRLAMTDEDIKTGKKLVST